MRRFFQLTIPVWFVRTFLILMLLLVLGHYIWGGSTFPGPAQPRVSADH